MQLALLMVLGVLTGATVALQNVINASLGRYAGELGAVFVVAISGALLVLVALLILPTEVNLKSLPGPNRWYLYLGGLLGLLIVGAPIVLVPRIGATATVTTVVIGQLLMAVMADQFGLFGTPRIPVSLPRLIGVLLLASGAYLVVRA